jgi:Uma2 family endonuclease/transcriptional regulator with XRE-family HTH domain
MLTVKEMLVLKQDLGFSYEYIAEKSGVPLSTVQKVFSRTTATPRRTTIEALNKAFDLDYNDWGKEKMTIHNYSDYDDEPYEPCVVCDSGYVSEIPESSVNVVNEAPGSYGVTDGTSALKLSDETNIIKQVDGIGTLKTIDDYLKLPEGIRVELIDGVFYDMAAPTTIHQKIGSYINIELEKYIDSNNGKCVAFIAPTDVQLDCDNKTMVQPDVLVVCDRDKITRARIVGAPDFVVEVLSESNWYHDVVRKERKYRNAGVREYWIVVPEKRTVLVYKFEKGALPTEYTFQDKIPVGIWDCKCVVDFAVLSEKIAFLWDK